MARLHSPSCVLLSAGCEPALFVCVRTASAAFVSNAAFMVGGITARALCAPSGLLFHGRPQRAGHLYNKVRLSRTLIMSKACVALLVRYTCGTCPCEACAFFPGSDTCLSPSF